MQKQEKINENELQDEVYISKPPVIRIILASLIVILIAFFMNFPVEQKLTGLIESQIKKNRKCPITYSQFVMDLFLLPELNFKNVNISGRCFGNMRSRGIDFSNVNLNVVRPTVLPPGVLIETKAKEGITDLNIRTATGITSAFVKIEKSFLNSALITEIGKLPVKLKGSISIDASLDTDYTDVTKADFHLTSKDLSLPPQRVIILEIKGLSLAPLVLKGSLENDLVKVLKAQVGNSTTKIEAIFSDGTIKLNKTNPRMHIVNIVGRVRLSAEFLKEFPILAPFLSNANIDANGFYKIELKGPMSQLRPKFL